MDRDPYGHVTHRGLSGGFVTSSLGGLAMDHFCPCGICRQIDIELAPSHRVFFVEFWAPDRSRLNTVVVRNDIIPAGWNQRRIVGMRLNIHRVVSFFGPELAHLRPLT